MAGLLLVAGPFLAARLDRGPAALAAGLAAVEPVAGVGLMVLFLVAAQIAVWFFTTAGTLLITRDLIVPFVLPDLTPRGGRLAARVALAVAFALTVALAAFTPLAASVFGGLALPLSAQMLPAILGLAFVPWISRRAVITGLIVGWLLVLFTEPPGLILIEGLFLDLPWGRWPLTVHSAAWGLVFNAAAVLLVSVFTRTGVERALRDQLHDEFASRWAVDFGGPAGRGAKWSLTLIWAFFALGPGAILGNTLFSHPFFTEGEAVLGVPSLWVWQLFFWLIGVTLVWWLAYRSGLGFTSEGGLRKITLGEPLVGPSKARAPGWIAASLARVTER